jgi:hypothetical protein
LLLRHFADIAKGTLKLRKDGGFGKTDWFLVYLMTHVKHICYAASKQQDSENDKTWDPITK